MPDRYAARRAEFESKFATAKRTADPAREVLSPSGRFIFREESFQNVETGWRYSRGVLRRDHDGAVMADIKRNHGGFWHAWVQHPNEHEYLLCGEDYQGYSIIECDTGRMAVHFPDEGHEGLGFCWYAVRPSPDGRTLAVEGCYWACPSEIVFVDFTDPLTLPLPELARFEHLDRVVGWQDASQCAFSAFQDAEEEPPSIGMTWSRSADNDQV